MWSAKVNRNNQEECVKSQISFLLKLAAFCGAVLLSTSCQAEEEPWVAPARAAKKKNPITVSPESVSQGQKIYTANCLTCHGTSGRGDGPGAAAILPKKPGNLSDSKLWAQSDGAIYWKVTEGKAPMPTFEKTVSEEDRWNVVNYVRTLSPKPAEK